MKLEAFLKLSRMTEVELARRAKCSQATVNRVRHGVGNWSFDLLQRICAATDGAVTLNDFAREQKQAARKSS